MSGGQYIIFDIDLTNNFKKNSFGEADGKNDIHRFKKNILHLYLTNIVILQTNIFQLLQWAGFAHHRSCHSLQNLAPSISGSGPSASHYPIHLCIKVRAHATSFSVNDLGLDECPSRCADVPLALSYLVEDFSIICIFTPFQ